MKLIPLTRGLFTKVDDEDFEQFAIYRWYADKSKNNWRPRRTIRVGGKVKTRGIFLYREIVQAKPGQHVDHINGDTLDNRKCNLRICTNSENMRNRKRQRNNTSGFKGVYWNKRKRKWVTKIRKDGKSHHGGMFANKIDAARRYNELAKELFGSFANLNKVTVE